MPKLPAAIIEAAGITDPFRTQIQFYRMVHHILNSTYFNPLSYHGIEPDIDALAQVVRRSRKMATSSFTGLLQYETRQLANQTIERAHTTKPIHEAPNSAQEWAAQITQGLHV
jgi:hypothetical protein